MMDYNCKTCFHDNEHDAWTEFNNIFISFVVYALTKRGLVPKHTFTDMTRSNWFDFWDDNNVTQGNYHEENGLYYCMLGEEKIVEYSYAHVVETEDGIMFEFYLKVI